MKKIYWILLGVIYGFCSNAQEFRSIDGAANNNFHTEWGSKGSYFLNTTKINYEDSISTINSSFLPNPRLLSNNFSSQISKNTDKFQLSQFFWAFGQFIIHDINQTSFDQEESYSVNIPDDDRYFNPDSQLVFYRTLGALGYDKDHPRLYQNETTAYLDGSGIYGSDATTAKNLRSFDRGTLRVSNGNLLVWNTLSGSYNSQIVAEYTVNSKQFNDNQKYFYTGDKDVNNNPLLLSIHTLFLREHNRICKEIKSSHPDYSDNTIYQLARKKVIALIQSIVYREWLPAQGINLPEYVAYNPSINVQLSNLYSTIFAHGEFTMQDEEILRLTNEGTVSLQGNTTLVECAYNPFIINLSGGIESFIKGMTKSSQQVWDLKINDAVRNQSIIAPYMNNTDGAAYDIFLCRDRGLPDFNTIRSNLGLIPYAEFNFITTDESLNEKLRSNFNAVGNIDAWIGLMSESKKDNTIYGETISKIVYDQFLRLRDGDRFYFENEDFTPEELTEIKNTKMKDIIIRNTTLTDIKDNVFSTKENIVNYGPQLPKINLSAFFYPNPVSDILNVKVFSDKEDVSTVSLSDVNGRKVFEKKINLTIGENYLNSFDMSSLSSGLYFLRVKTSEDYSTLKIIKE